MALIANSGSLPRETEREKTPSCTTASEDSKTSSPKMPSTTGRLSFSKGCLSLILQYRIVSRFRLFPRERTVFPPIQRTSLEFRGHSMAAECHPDSFLRCTD